MKARTFLDIIGVNQNAYDFRENMLSLIGGFLSIFFILITSYWLLDPQTAVYIVPSMGATAVLLFAAPHVPFSQPWNVFGGHLLSAAVGVACWHWIPNVTIAASASVGVAIGVMYFTKCIHPPGGATALAMVIGSERLHDLGYAYILQPIFINTVTILVVAVVFNYPFKWRRYPAYLRPMSKPDKLSMVETGYAPINHGDFVYALSHIETYVDIDEADLIKIYQLATSRHAELNPPKS